MSRIYDWYRYHFVRKKSPLSYIWWSDILKRNIGSEGVYNVSIATVQSDCAISLSYGAPDKNRFTILVYDAQDRLKHKVEVKLSYRSMMKIKSGFAEARRESLKILKEGANQ